VRTVDVQRSIPAPIGGVFDVLSDHANYSRFRGIQRSELVREGDAEPNGLGALRRIHTWPLRFEEEITAFERPVRMDYLIVAVNAPLEHRGGSLVLEEASGGTHVTWTSTFGFTPGVIGPLMTAVAVPVLSLGFSDMLRGTERVLTA
jgi:hypothetical protein